MYLDRFHFKIKPFTLSTDPHFLWVGAGQRQALATLAYGLQANDGIVVLGGEFGSGKTTLINAFVKDLDDEVRLAMFPEPGRTSAELMLTIAERFGIRGKCRTRDRLEEAFRRALDDQPTCHRLLLIVDEAQRLTVDMREEILRLSRLEHRGSRLIHTILAGQSELFQQPAGALREAFIKEVSAACKLQRFTIEETTAYIDHRLQMAGAASTPFTEEALATIQAMSGGLPRIINLLCDFSLLHAHMRDCDRVDAETVSACKDQFQIARRPGTGISQLTVREMAPLPAVTTTPGRPAVWRRLRIAALGLLLCFLAGGYLISQDDHRDFFAEGKPALVRLMTRVASSLHPPGIEPAEVANPTAGEARKRSTRTRAEIISPHGYLPSGDTPSASPETISEARPALAPQAPPKSPPPAETEIHHPPAVERSGLPPEITEPPIADAVPPKPDVTDRPSPPTVYGEMQPAADPGELIDWLIKEKQQRRSPP